MDAKIITRVNQAMSSAREERLIWIGQQMSDHRWEIGDLINRQIEENHAAGYEIPDMAVYAHVAGLVGKSSSSVRRYAYVAEFFPPAARDEYEPLQFEHFKFTLRFKDRWREILSAALRHMDSSGGRLPRIDWLESNFTGANQLTAQLDDVEERAEIDDIIHGAVLEEAWADEEPVVPEPGAPSTSGGFVINSLVRVLDWLRKEGERLPVSEETRERWLTVCDAFVSVLDEIRREINNAK